MTRLTWIFVAVLVGGCGDDGEEVDRLGIGAQCTDSEQCNVDDGQSCLLGFKGGYCGRMGCTADLDCPALSACIAHTDGVNYCFRTCVDKPECNVNRDVDNESNCSSSATFVDPQNGRKACVPPSGG
ncbi:MAG TPA: hypothetical protein VIV11_36215 [Kofleriaceae bacterium]